MHVKWKHAAFSDILEGQRRLKIQFRFSLASRRNKSPQKCLIMSSARWWLNRGGKGSTRSISATFESNRRQEITCTCCRESKIWARKLQTNELSAGWKKNRNCHVREIHCRPSCIKIYDNRKKVGKRITIFEFKVSHDAARNLSKGFSNVETCATSWKNYQQCVSARFCVVKLHWMHRKAELSRSRNIKRLSRAHFRNVEWLCRSHFTSTIELRANDKVFFLLSRWESSAV